MKKCSQCHKMLPLTDFYLDRRDNKPRSYCKLCSHQNCKRYRHSEGGKQQKKLIRQKYGQQMTSFCNELKSITKCQVCNEPCIECLDFHHLHSKLDVVTRLGTWSKLLSEIKKCVVLCCNCHRKGHGGLIDFPSVPVTVPDELLHKYIQKPERVKTISEPW